MRVKHEYVRHGALALLAALDVRTGKVAAASTPGTSWLNQVLLFHHPEEVLTPNDFASTGKLSQTLLAFADRYNLTARPFNWKFSVHDLTALLRRISQREPGPPGQQADLSQAA